MGAFGGHEVRERRWTGLDKLESRNRSPRSLLVALVLASVGPVTSAALTALPAAAAGRCGRLCQRARRMGG